jgi:histidinol-phosphate aminotransferase
LNRVATEDGGAEPSPPLRSLLTSVPAYSAGRTTAPEDTAGDAALLASNEIPWGPLPGVAEALARSAATVNRYPDPEATILRRRIGERFGLTPDHVAVGAGSVEVCRQAVTACIDAGDAAAIPDPSFPEYRTAVMLAGGRPVLVPLRPDHSMDLDALAAAAGRARVVFVCNPNNPTGTGRPAEDIAAFVASVPPSCLVIVDEAYAEFAGPGICDAPTLVGRYPNLLVLRTFSKAYGLAGLRIGYGLAQPHLVEALRKTRVTFGVGSLSQQAAIASLGQHEELHRRVREVIAERQRVQGELSRLGVDVPPSEANFVWLPLGGRAETVRRACEAAQVQVRPSGPSAIRVTVGTSDDNDRMFSAVSRALSPAGRRNLAS